MRTGRGSRSSSASTSKRAPSTSGDLGTRILWPYREARTGSNGSSMTTMVGTPPACRLRTAPRPTTSELRTIAHGLHAASSMSHATVPVPMGDVAGQRAGHVPRSYHEAAQGAEAAGGGRPEEVEAGHTRFEPDVQVGLAGAGPQGLQQGRRTHERSLRPVRDEISAGSPGHDLHFRATLVEQGRRFERALPAAHHHDPLTGEPTQVAVVEGMRNQWCGQSGKLRRAPGEWTDARGHHHAPRVELFPILQAHVEPPRVCGDVRDRAPVYVRYHLLLEPLPVPYEVLERRRLGVRDAVERVIAIESQLAIGIGDIRGARAGTQEHAPRHVPFPELHWLTEAPSFDVLGAEVRSGGQSVRPRPDDRDMTRCPAVRHSDSPRSGIPAATALGNPHAVLRVAGALPAPGSMLWRGRSVARPPAYAE